LKADTTNNHLNAEINNKDNCKYWY
jgi:hypothetical protein